MNSREFWRHPLWLSRVRDSGFPAVHPESQGWRVVEQDGETTVWQDDIGDSLSLRFGSGTIGLLALTDRDAVRRHCRKLAVGMDSVLVDADIVSGSAGPAVMLVYKRFEKRALTFTGMLFVGRAGQWWVWTVVGCERRLNRAQFTGYPLSKVRRELQRLTTVNPVGAEVTIDSALRELVA